MRFLPGLKLWSVNTAYAPHARRLRESGGYDFIELFAVPGTYDDTIAVWRALPGPFVVHAPHHAAGVNLADPARAARNRELLEEARRFADALAAEQIVFHGGVNGVPEEVVRQLRAFAEPRALLENKPLWGIGGGLRCLGASPSEVRGMLDGIGCGFCLDIGHAICAANAVPVPPVDYLREFLALRPALIHLSDGDYAALTDSHDHLGEGNFPLKEILEMLPDAIRITLETKKNFSDRLDDCDDDLKRLRELSE